MSFGVLEPPLTPFTSAYNVIDTVARTRGEVGNTWGFTVIDAPGAPGGRGEARGAPHLGPGDRG